MKTAYIALGSNISKREEFLKSAIEMLEEPREINVIEKSAVYETAPVGYTDQSDFLNMVVKVTTSLSPLQLLDHCQSIESELGRKRIVKWGPRTIDLDILLYNQENMIAERLTIPHPHMQERAFVMVPLAELDQEAFLPHLERSVLDILEALPKDEVESVREWGKI
ncbi:2-amino-4-hydroxy-6-hydroxymethyldihydropteridine diphosphokinase [Halobacillus sp. BBL2006]|uniref:2-amino-4-hydroxy-6- hydroxymethyldihydropteridine diphosphokinase n=1 Tax=Halobacillus sp. BBL2006 TaxID=1543706 RepID=UPI0005423166|nr:2-amino-4-hydroxy-6-hydroxymethyldihydropteridine diphosphokinase [Halobacillus sp. BBL2006]KHE72899.1 2-amino-4-hydroxy-6-hydroxymethyldihydropteridine pyrophosphokinase [Halobacillus sp. BBL2006]